MSDAIKAGTCQRKYCFIIFVSLILLFNCNRYKVITGIHFWNRKKVHRFTNNLQGLQKVMVKDFSWNIIPWNALLIEKTFKQLSILDIDNYGFILNTCQDTAKHTETRVGFPVIFSRLRWPIEPKFYQVCYFIYKFRYTKCGPLDITVYLKCPMALIIASTMIYLFYRCVFF